MHRTRRQFVRAATAGAFTVALAGCSDSTGEPTGTPTETATAEPTGTETGTGTVADATVAVRSLGDLGDVLVDGVGVTLYMFDNDDQGSDASSCTGGCLDTWPPLTVGSESAVTAGGDVTAPLSTFERDDGSLHVVASGWPLYYYAGDGGPGDANGQAVGDVWWVLRPDGTPFRG